MWTGLWVRRAPFLGSASPCQIVPRSPTRHLALPVGRSYRSRTPSGQADSLRPSPSTPARRAFNGTSPRGPQPGSDPNNGRRWPDSDEARPGSTSRAREAQQACDHRVPTMGLKRSTLGWSSTPTRCAQTERLVKLALMDIADRVVLLIDHTKFAARAPVFLCDWDRLSLVVTDRQPPETILSHLQSEGVEVVLPHEVKGPEADRAIAN